MAKLKAPLMSLGASGQLGKALVFFPWKGLDVVREYVVPSNPKSTSQTTHRGYMTAAVAAIHAAQALAANALDEIDQVAYALLGSLQPTPRTWFNTICKEWIDQYVAALHGVIFHDGTLTEQDAQISHQVWLTDEGANAVTAMDVWYGRSKTNLINSEAMVDQGAGRFTAVVAGLTNGTKYFFQYRPTAHADYVGMNSGIYHATPAA